MRFKLLLVSGLFGVGILLLPFSYVSYTYQSENSYGAGIEVSVVEAQGEASERWSLRDIWQSIMRQVGGVLDIAAQAIQAVTDVPGQLFDITSNNPPDTQGDVQSTDPFVNGGVPLPALPVPQIYDGTLIMNVPLRVNNALTVGGLTRLNDLLVDGVFEINNLDVPGVGTFGTIVSGPAQLGSLTVAGNTQLNTLSVTGPVTFANLTANNLSAGDVTVSNVLVAQGGVTTGGADINLQGGDIFAANVIYELIAGDNIEIGGTVNAPIITANVPRISLGERVRNLNGISGGVSLIGGTDITVSVAGSNIILANTSDLSTVAARGGCVDCILDADVIDALTINGGTIDDTIIGSTTPAQAFFTNITVTGTGTSTFAGPINVTSGCVSVNGVCLGIGAVNLDDLLDVSIAGAVDGDFLRYNGSVWANASSGELGIGDGSYLGLNDTPDAYIASALVFVNGAGNALTQSGGLTFDGARLAIGSTTGVTTLTVAGDVSIRGRQAIRFYETDNSNYVGFRASTTLASDVVWTLPVSDGLGNHVLVTDGSGNLRFSDVSAVGGGASTFLTLTDTPSAFIAGALPYTASTSDRLLFSSNFVFDGSRLGIGTSSPNHTLTVNGSVYLGRDISTPGLTYSSTRDTVSVGTALSEQKFTVAQGSILQRGGTSTEHYAPTLVGSVNLPDSTYNLFVAGERAYTVGRSSAAEFNVIDITNKKNPTVMGFVNLPDTARDVVALGDYAFVVTDVSGNDFHVIDVSDPGSPVEVASLPLTTSAFSVAAHGRYAYVGTGVIAGHEFFIIDVLDPTNPVQVGSLEVSANINSISIQGDYAYVVTDSPSNLVSILIANPAAPVIVDTIALPASGTGISLRGDYAFVVTNLIGDDFHIFDISDPANLASLSSTPLSTGANDVSVAGHYAYVTTSGTGNDLHVIDISDLTNPVEVGSVELNSGAAWGVRVRGRYAYLTSDSVGTDFHIYDVTGIEAQSMLAHSLESGSLSVIGNIVAAGSLSLKQGLRVGADGIVSDGELLIRSTNPSLILGNLAVGTTSAPYTLTIGGDVSISGAIYDATFTAGTPGQVLVANGTSQVWTATSSLGLSQAFTTSQQLATLLADETGTAGSVVFSVSPTLTGTVQVAALSASAGLSLTGAASNISLGSNFLSGDGGDEGIYIDGDGFVGIGTTTPVSELSVEGTIMASNLYGGGTATLSTDAQGNIIRTPSDANLKQNVRSIDGALEAVLALRGVRYEWVDATRFGDQTEIGFIAQEVDLILPEVVRKGGEYWSLNTPNIVAMLVEAIKELWKVVSGNQEKIELLETRVEYLEALMDVESSLDVMEQNSGSVPSPAESTSSAEESDTETATSSEEISLDETDASETSESGEQAVVESDSSIEGGGHEDVEPSLVEVIDLEEVSGGTSSAAETND